MPGAREQGFPAGWVRASSFHGFKDGEIPILRDRLPHAEPVGGYNEPVPAPSIMPEDATPMTAYCSACGAEVLAEAAFCHHCGHQLKDLVPTSSAGTADGLAGTSDQHGSEPATAQAVPANGAAALPLGEAEQTLWEGGYSAKAMLGGWMLSAMVTLLATGVGMTAGLDTGVFLGLLCAALCFGGIGLYVMYLKLSVHYELTSQRFIHQAGLLRRVTDQIEVIDVDDVAFSQGLLQRIAGVGTIKIMSNDCSHSELFLEGVDRVEHVAGLIDAARRAERCRRGLFIEAV
jgi:hypothetical protein